MFLLELGANSAWETTSLLETARDVEVRPRMYFWVYAAVGGKAKIKDYLRLRRNIRKSRVFGSFHRRTRRACSFCNLAWPKQAPKFSYGAKAIYAAFGIARASNGLGAADAGKCANFIG